jgi:hypothetical protein
MNAKGHLSSKEQCCLSLLTPPRSTTSNRPSHEPHGPASVNQGVAGCHHKFLKSKRRRASNHGAVARSFS